MENGAKNDAQSIAEYAVEQLRARGCSFANLRTYDDSKGYRFTDIAGGGKADRHPDIMHVRGIGPTGCQIAVLYGDPSDEEREPILRYATAIGIAYLARVNTLSTSRAPKFLETVARYDEIDLGKQSPADVDAQLESVACDLIAMHEAAFAQWIWIEPKPGEQARYGLGLDAPDPGPEPEDTLSDDLLIAVDDASFEDLVLKAPGPVLVDFWAPWCGPCKRLTPLLKQLAHEYPQRITVAKLNVDENPASKSRYDVKGIPRMILFEGGRPVDDRVGLMRYANLVEHFIERT